MPSKYVRIDFRTADGRKTSHAVSEFRTLFGDHRIVSGETESGSGRCAHFLAGDEENFLFACRRSFREKAIWIIFHPCGTDRTCWGVTWEEWRSLFQRIEELGKYEYVILDLSESIQGLLDVLQMCIKVFTLTREDKMFTV